MIPITQLSHFINAAIPYAWDDSESWFEFLGKVLAKVNELVTASNEYFTFDMQAYIQTTLNTWVEDGTLQEIVQISISSKASQTDMLQGDIDGKAYTDEQIAGVNSSIDSVNDGVNSSINSVNENITLLSNKIIQTYYESKDAANTYTNAKIAEIDAKLLSLASGGPKKTFDTFALLGSDAEANTNAGKLNIYVVSATGNWYYWNGSAWTSGGAFQSALIADNTVGITALAPSVFEMLGFKGYKVNSKQLSAEYPVYVVFSFDSNGLTFTANAPYRFEYEFYTDDGNPNAVSWIMFANDSAVVTNLDGTWDATTPQDVTSVELGIYYKLGSDHLTKKYDATKRYIKPIIKIDVDYPAILSQLYVRNVKLFCGSVELPFVGAGLFMQSVDSTLTLINYEFGLKNKMSLDVPLNISKWVGKKAVFLGDSITVPAYATIGYIAWLKNNFQLYSAINYGANGSCIAERDNDPAQSFVDRYSAMTNDADLIMVMGGTNDFGVNVVPLGTIADTTAVTFNGALNVLMTGLITKYPKGTIVFCTPLHRAFDSLVRTEINDAGQTLKQFRDAIIERCEYYGLPCIDLWAMSGMQPNVPANKTAYMPDGLHPNNDGHKLLADKIAGFLTGI